MSLAHSPSIVRSGLVFYYDMNNTQKSWKGKPTTNLLTNTNNLQGGSWSGYCAGNMNNVTYNTTEVKDPFGGYGATRIIMDGSTSCGGGGTWGFLWGAGGLSSGTTYTASIYARADRATSFTLGINDSAGVGGQSVDTNWKRFTYTYTTGATDRGLQVIRGDATSGIKLYFYGAQLEVGSFATPYVSSGASQATRSNTQSVLDLTGVNTVTMTEATYESTGLLKFDGSNDYLTISTFNNKPTTQITCEAWIKPTKTSVGTGTIRGGAISATNSTYLGIIDSADGGNTFAMHWANQTSSSRPSNFNGSIPNNAWSHLVGTYDGANSKAYLNGVEIWTSAQTGTIADATYVIGTYGNNLQDGVHNFNGYIGTALIYNRGLSASEVVQNFNAYRDRYGI